MSSSFTSSESSSSPQEWSTDPQILQQSASYIGRWNRLISSTNWEKGEIICQWRQQILAAGDIDVQFSDEAWSRIVGGVSPQHVGRLRRTYERFGTVYTTYEGLYWSHFYAALDWNDAEMWLEGAVQNRWSISRMRTKRWETLGLGEDQKPREQDVVAVEVDEEASSLTTGSDAKERARNDNADYIEGPLYEGPDFGDEPTGRRDSDAPFDDSDMSPGSAEPAPPAEKWFAGLTDLPDDVDAAVEQFKLAIIRHKSSGWQEITLDKMVAVLTALQKLAQTPTDIS
jgi:hypothetical protein